MPTNKYAVNPGDVFGTKTLIKELPKRNGKIRRGLFRCVCGKDGVFNLMYAIKVKHDKCKCEMKGMHTHPLYGIYYGIKQRCNNKKDSNYNRYGGKGVKICEQWELNFLSFYNWALSNGWQKGLHIDRYPNKIGNYEPSNCRIVTHKDNSNNRIDNTLVTYNGIEYSLSDACEMVGISKTKRETIRYRLNKGISFEDAISLPIKERPKHGLNAFHIMSIEAHLRAV